MNKTEFLSRLRIALAPLPEEERNAAMVYYEEFFSEAGEENEQSVISEFGTPEELARSIVEENNRENPANNQASVNPEFNRNRENAFYNQNGANPAYNNGGTGYYSGSSTGANPPPIRQNGKWSNGQIALFIVLLVLSSPIWMGFLAGIVGLIVGILGALICIIAAVGCCAVAFLISGVVALFQEPPAGIMLLGMGFVFAGLIPLAIYPLCKLAVKGVIAFGKWIGELCGKIGGRKENTQ
ncbi:MAG TPA: hypothetical protein DDX91_03315 [Ruminococcaceae bacterium]|nr:hypothetical protein [Oscillospiraceae bacterium]